MTASSPQVMLIPVSGMPTWSSTRAWGLVLFDLLRNYSFPYAKDPNGPGFPIVLTFEQLSTPKRDSISTQAMPLQAATLLC
jgi:hypothetical protein